MDVNTAILTRRSIRKFIPFKIDDKFIETILKAGFHAPSAGNKRPVHFIVIKDREILKKLSEAKQEAEMINNAELAIVVCGDKNIQPYHDFLHEDCSASIENILLFIHGNGLGAVWCGVPQILDECFQIYINTLNLPDNIIPIGTIAIGGIGEKKEYIDRYNDKKIHYEKW
jgi:nitroreductase